LMIGTAVHGDNPIDAAPPALAKQISEFLRSRS